MCARRFLAVIFVLTLLVVAGSFAIYKWGGNVLLSQATPQGRFDSAKAGDGPDYAKIESWIARPDLPDNPAGWLPEGVAQGGGGAAVFYLHPTTYLLRDRWNAPLQPGTETEFRTRLFVQSQASALNAAGEVWAPRYRQAAFGAFLLNTADAQKALLLAYTDVESAFDEFLKQVPTNRPVILAGHSQGALHLSRLLAKRRAELKDRLIAAYVVGWPLSSVADLPVMGKACERPDQLGCILSWQSFGEPANPDMVLDAWEGSEGMISAERRRQDMVCVNPLTGTKDGIAPPSANPGTLIPSANLASATLSPGLVGARCGKGFLILSGAVPAMGPYVLPGNNYHVYDYALFWGAVRSDSARRLAAWQAR